MGVGDGISRTTCQMAATEKNGNARTMELDSRTWDPESRMGNDRETHDWVEGKEKRYGVQSSEAAAPETVGKISATPPEGNGRQRSYARSPKATQVLGETAMRLARGAKKIANPAMTMAGRMAKWGKRSAEVTRKDRETQHRY